MNLYTLALRAALDELDAVEGGGVCPGKVDHPAQLSHARGARPVHRDNGELARLELLGDIRRLVDAAIEQAVVEARAEVHGRGPLQSWENVGAVLGISKQAAAKRYGDGRAAGHRYLPQRGR